MLTSRSAPEQQKNTARGKENVESQTFSKRKIISRVATLASLLCSFVAISLHTAKSFRVSCIFQIQIFDTAYDCVQGLLLVAVVLGILAVILSSYKQVAKNIDEFSSDDPPSDSQAISDKMLIIKNTDSEVPNNKKIDQLFQLETRTKSNKDGSKNTAVQTQFEETSKDVHLQNQPILDTLIRKSPKKENIPSCSGPLVPYVEHQGVKTQKQKEMVPFHTFNSKPNNSKGQDLSRTWGMKSSNVIGNNGVVEFVASRKVKYFPEGSIHAQEELKIKKVTTIYRGPDASVPFPNPPIKLNFRERSKEEVRKRFNPFHGSLFKPENDHVSEVATKMGELNFFY